MAVTSNNTRKNDSRPATAAELVKEITKNGKLERQRTPKCMMMTVIKESKTVLATKTTSNTQKKKCYNCDSTEHMRNKCHF